MRYLTGLALGLVSAVCLGQPAVPGSAQDDGSAPVAAATRNDVARMTSEQQQQFRCEQTREQIRGQLERGVTLPSDRDNLVSLRKNEKISCVPPLVSPPPSALTAPAQYPAQAMRQGHQGVVIVRVELAPDGAVTGSSVYRSSGFRELDNVALATVRHWHFDTQKGLSVRVPVSFSLAR
jgi:TonB family protein